MEEEKRIRLPVRRVVEQVLRSGDIDSRHVDNGVMLQGSKIHRKLQKKMGPDYEKEVSLRLDIEVAGIPATLFGRADGVIYGEDGTITIDEIKATTLPLDRLHEQYELQHTGQARCYACMLLAQMEQPVEKMGVQLTYYQLDTDEIRRYSYTYTKEELDAFLEDLLARYAVWLRFERDWKALRDASIKETAFPFPAFRKGQRELAGAAYRTIVQGKKLYAQAPTGIGKTLSTLFPSIKAMGEGQADKIFYLTAKTVTRAVAEDAVRRMGEQGLRFKSLTLRAKDKSCPCEETICNPEYCPFAKGHYNRINDALLDILENHDLITPELTGEYAHKHRVCPHEFALDLSLWADMVVGDYNHVFDPVIFLQRFFATVSADYIFLIDETHNLADRVREMYTASLKKSVFSRLGKELKGKSSQAAALRKALKGINQYLLDLRKGAGDRKSIVETEHDKVLHALVCLLITAAEEWLAREEGNEHALEEEVLELFFAARFFQLIGELYDEHFTTITEIEGSEVEVTLFCLDPSKVIGECLERAKASVLFSATLTPLDYYRDILGGTPEDKRISLPSPFERERLLVAAYYGVSTKYVHREQSLLPVAEAIHLAVSQKKGNYIVYFPSHAYLRQVHETFRMEYPQIETLVQQGAMGEEERERFLNRFYSGNSGTLVGFCVLGGIFSEGIDLQGDRLIGSIIVGVGLPGISLRQDLIRDYFNQKSGSGYDYAYVYPGMNKVLQAAGRVIRSERDYGIVVLIDSRFHTPKYHSLYPAYWSHMQMARNLKELGQVLEAFPLFREKGMEGMEAAGKIPIEPFGKGE